jgi:selT/selW/selH-like putative selenoprotein
MLHGELEIANNEGDLIFSYSCGYRKVFEQYAAMLQQKYPEISVEGDLYPPSVYKIMLSRALVCEQVCTPLFIYIRTVVYDKTLKTSRAEHMRV